MATPLVPPRPQRSQAGSTAATNEIPIIPPRPIRKTDLSPEREAYSRSPLNVPPPGMGFGSRRASQDFAPAPSTELPRRPPSVSLPSIGQEGSEYSSYDQLPAEAHGVTVEASHDDSSTAGELQKSVSADLPIHAPRASVSRAAAKKQIETVTRTDSTQAAAAGIGKPQPADDVHKALAADPALNRVTGRATHDLQPLRNKTSFNRSSSSLQPLERSTSRPGSVHGGNDYEHGIPEIGKQVPLLAYAGDVQAPSPAPSQTQFPSGIGFFNDGSVRNHTRKRSSRQEFFPPDTYGLRHDQVNQDKFEKAWAAKHPEEAAKEEHYLHLPRPETALSSEQLNRLVHHTNDVGMGTSSNVIGTPDEEVAFNASQEYITRIATPQKSPAMLSERKKRPSSGSQPAVESPLRKASLKLNDGRRQADHAFESEDEQVFHIRPSSRKTNKVTGGGDADGKLDLGPHGEDGGYISEHTDHTPILASDEIIKRPGSAYMQAAIEPGVDRNADEHYDSDHGQWPSNSRRNSVNPPSHPSSRPGSVHGGVAGYHGGPLHRYVSHEEQHHSGIGTPLEEIEEYEPLFPEDEKEDNQPRKKFQKRPDLAHHHFPSQDIWEDTPDSLQYSATVSTPDLEKTNAVAMDSSAAATFETPEQEQQRRAENPNDMLSSNKTYAKPQFKSSVRDEVHARPGIQRFPSSDVWEDSPDTFNLTTTVSEPQSDESKPQADDISARPVIPARPERPSKLSAEVKPGQIESVAAKPKPTIPARPARPAQAGGASSAQAAASDVSGGVPLPKAKPAVPARPAGAKIAALQAGFMSDLNNRLKLGPQAPPKKESEAEVSEEAEKAPLADARKGRAKGPARRKPGAIAENKSSTFAFSPLITVWTIDEEDELTVQPESKKEEEEAPAPSVEEVNSVLASNESSNTQEPAMSLPPADGEDGALPKAAIGFEGDTPEPHLSAAAIEEQKAVQGDFETALREAKPAPASYEARIEQDAKAATTTAIEDVPGREGELSHLSGHSQDPVDAKTGDVDDTGADAAAPQPML